MELWYDPAMPLALSGEEENRMLHLLGSTEKEQAQKTVMEHNVRLVAWIVNQMIFENHQDYPAPEELMSEGMVGLVKGVQTFDPSKSNHLSAYMVTCIRNEIRMYLRREQRQPWYYSFPLREQAGQWSERKKESQPQLRTEAEEKRDEIFRLRQAMARLPAEEQKLLWLRYGFLEEPQTQTQTAAKMGVSQSYLSRWERKILAKLKKMLTEDN